MILLLQEQVYHLILTPAMVHFMVRNLQSYLCNVFLSGPTRLTDAIGRKHQCSDIQLDFQIPSSFDLQLNTPVQGDKGNLKDFIINFFELFFLDLEARFLEPPSEFVRAFDE